MSKLRIAVLRGGPSDEYDVSLQTGAAVIDALRDSSFEPIDIVIARNGEWLVEGIGREPRHALAAADAVFNALHGAYGEDGTVQRILDALGIPYTGSKAYASSLAMNKILAKEHLYDAPFLMAPHMRITRAGNADLYRVAHMLDELMGPEFIIKPVAGGSSIGAHRASGNAELIRALQAAFLTVEEVLVEKCIRGKEATVGVIERFRGEDLYVLPPVEIVPPAHEPFFTARAKYSGETDEICPGRFSMDEKRDLAEFAKQIHMTLGLAQYSRSDFIVADEIPGRQARGIYFLEANTLPGLSRASLMPKALAAVGSSDREFVHHVLSEALKI